MCSGHHLVPGTPSFHPPMPLPLPLPLPLPQPHPPLGPPTASTSGPVADPLSAATRTLTIRLSQFCNGWFAILLAVLTVSTQDMLTPNGLMIIGARQG